MKLILQNLNNQKTEQVPFWFMRQAGRYLPEYRDLRAKEGGFLDLVYNPESASEVTLQPIRRYGMSAAILFSDILVIPQALGQNLSFEAGEGPKLDALKNPNDLETLDVQNIDKILNPIYETVSFVRSKLQYENFNQTALIGFAGSPWTVACYMIEGGGSQDFQKVKNWAKEDPISFQKLIDILVEATSHYLIKQIEAGAEVLQLFDSWAGILKGEDFNRWSVSPTKQIIDKIKAQYPHTPIIGFPREAGQNAIFYAENTGIQAIGMDYSMEPAWAKNNLQNLLPVQGNLDPQILLQGGAALEKQANKILETFSSKPFIFNLGHGVIKETPTENVEKLCSIVRDFKS